MCADSEYVCECKRRYWIVKEMTMSADITILIPLRAKFITISDSVTKHVWLKIRPPNPNLEPKPNEISLAKITPVCRCGASQDGSAAGM